MEVMEAIKKRCSIRSYQDKPVEEEKLKLVLEAARLAPSAKNKQESKFIVVRDKSLRQKLMVAAKNQSFVGEAPVIIVCCSADTEYKMTCGQLAYPIDGAIALDHMTLKAVEEGLGSCWIGAFFEEQVKEILNIPAEVRIVDLLVLGYPKEPSVTRKGRLPLEQIIMNEKWQQI